MRQACFYLSILLFCSCGHVAKDENDELLKMTNDRLLSSNIFIGSFTITAFKELEEKSKDVYTAYRGVIWFEKAKKIQELTIDIRHYVAGLKDDIEKEVTINPSGDIGDFVSNSDHGKNLFKVLQQYKSDLLSVDSSVRQEFDSTIIILPKEFALSGAKENDFARAFIKNKNSLSILTFLTSIENNIIIAENLAIRFCNYKVSDNVFHFDTYGAIFSQNSSIVKSGEEIEILAGVGAFSIKARPNIQINGKKIALDSDGAARYKFKVPAKQGRYSVPAKIEYTDEIGNKQTVERRFYYTVSPCQ